MTARVDTDMSKHARRRPLLVAALVAATMHLPGAPAAAQPGSSAAPAPASARAGAPATVFTGTTRRVRVKAGATRAISLTPAAALRAPRADGEAPHPGQVVMLELTGVRAAAATELEVFLLGPFGPVPLGLVAAGPTASRHLLTVRTDLRAGAGAPRLLLRARAGAAISVGALAIRADWPAEQAKLGAASITPVPAASAADVTAPVAIGAPGCTGAAAAAPELTVPLALAPRGIELLRGMGEVSPGLHYSLLLAGSRVADGAGLLVDVDLDVPHGAASKRTRLGTVDVGAGLSVLLPATEAMAPYMGVDLTKAKAPTLRLTLRAGGCRPLAIDVVRLVRDARPPVAP